MPYPIIKVLYLTIVILNKNIKTDSILNNLIGDLMSKKISIVVSADLETLKILEKLEIDAGNLLEEAAKVKLKEWQEKWKEENKESIEALNSFTEKHGHFRPE